MQKTWAQLVQESENVHYTRAPGKRKNVEPRVSADMTPDQLEVLVKNKFSTDARVTEFIWKARKEIRYVPQRSKWLLWDGHVWKWDDKGHAREMVKEYGRSFLLAGGEDKEVKDANKAAHKFFTSVKGINEVLNLASSDPMMVANIDEFDANVYDLNTPSGVVDLYTGEMTSPDPAKLVKRSTTVAPDTSCPTPKYERLLSEAFAGEPELSEYFEQMMGNSLIKAQDDQVFMYMFGASGSGKGTLMNIALNLLGKGEAGYAVYVDSSMFIQSRSQAHPTELMQFLGARMAVSSEITQGQKMDTGKLKKVTGGDVITGRFMGKDFVSFDASHTLWIMANDRLQVPHDDKGVWRRLRVIDFKHSKKSDEVINGLDSIISEEEGPGILARWIAKAALYLNEGYVTPQAVIEAGATYVAEQDTVSEWLEYNADTEDPEKFCAVPALRENYLAWCKQERKTAVGPKNFGDALEAKGYVRGKRRVATAPNESRQIRVHLGLSLL